MIQQIVDIFLLRKDFFIELIWEHLALTGISILIAAIIGLILGIVISEFKQFSFLVLGFTNVVYTIPTIALFGMLILFSGIGNTTAIIALTLYALLPMVRNTYTGIVSIDPGIIEAAIGMGSTKLQLLFRIKLPLAMLVILTGIRNMVAMTIATAGIAAFIGAGGLGVAIYRGISTNNTAMTFAGSILIAVMALLADYLLGLLEKIIQRKWRLASSK